MTITDHQLKTLATKDMKLHDKSKLKYKLSADSDAMDYRVLTSDEALFEISNMKENVITKMTRLVKEASIDCATYSKRGNTEQVDCVQYGEPSSTEMAFVPNISKQPDDIVQQQNQKTVEWRGAPYEFRGRKFISRKINDNIRNIYDLESLLSSTR